MITRIKTDNPTILAFEVDGKMSKEEMQEVLKEMVVNIKTTEQFSFYIEIKSLGGIEFGVFSDGLKFAFKHLTEYLKKLDKVALVTDKKWLNFIATVEYSFIPWVDLKAFPFTEKEVAMDWVKVPKQ